MQDIAPDQAAKSEMNEALWLTSAGGRFVVGPAPRPSASAGELIIRVRAVAVNSADVIPGGLRRFISPWVRYPTVIGTDIAGDVVEVGAGVDGFEPGSRVLAYAAGQDRSRNSSAEGAFQRYAVALPAVCTPIPTEMAFEQAAVIPLGLATAAAGLYEQDQLALPLPDQPGRSTGKIVLVWGASSSVGCNAVQLAIASGYEVIATASPRNHDFLRGLGAAHVFDYRDATVDQRVIAAVGDHDLDGVLAVGPKSLSHALRIVRRTPGRRRIASVYPDPMTRLRGLVARLHRTRVSVIWGGTPIHSPVGPAVFRRFLPAALEDGRFQPAPHPSIAGVGLEQLPIAFASLRSGVSASKLVVTVP